MFDYPSSYLPFFDSARRSAPKEPTEPFGRQQIPSPSPIIELFTIQQT